MPPWIEQAAQRIADRDFAPAARLCEQALAANPNDFSAQAILCHIHIQLDRVDDAEQILEKLRARADLSAAQFVEIASRLAEMGRIGQAIDSLRQAERTIGADPMLAYGRAQLHDRAVDYPAAIEAYEDAARRRPDLVAAVQRAGRLREEAQRDLSSRDHLDRIGRRIVESAGNAVLTGPFKGMRLHDSPDLAWVAMLIGSYEQELHVILEGMLARGHRTIINIGASGGYYAVGLAMRNRDAKVFAYETDDDRRSACAKLAEDNGVSNRVILGGACARSDLAAFDPQVPTMIVCDCEGCELDLLQPARVPILRRCDVICELHDFILPHLGERLIARFAPTHAITPIAAVPRSPAPYADLLAFLAPQEREVAVYDCRPAGMGWLAMRCIAI